MKTCLIPLIETQQAIEMADIYGNVLHSMTETFASIISNNPEQHENLGPCDHRHVHPNMVFFIYGMNLIMKLLNGELNAFLVNRLIAF